MFTNIFKKWIRIFLMFLKSFSQVTKYLLKNIKSTTIPIHKGSLKSFHKLAAYISRKENFSKILLGNFFCAEAQGGKKRAVADTENILNIFLYFTKNSFKFYLLFPHNLFGSFRKNFFKIFQIFKKLSRNFHKILFNIFSDIIILFPKYF